MMSLCMSLGPCLCLNPRPSRHLSWHFSLNQPSDQLQAHILVQLVPVHASQRAQVTQLVQVSSSEPAPVAVQEPASGHNHRARPRSHPSYMDYLSHSLQSQILFQLQLQNLSPLRSSSHFRSLSPRFELLSLLPC